MNIQMNITRLKSQLAGGRPAGYLHAQPRKMMLHHYYVRLPGFPMHYAQLADTSGIQNLH